MTGRGDIPPQHVGAQGLGQGVDRAADRSGVEGVERLGRQQGRVDRHILAHADDEEARATLDLSASLAHLPCMTLAKICGLTTPETLDAALHGGAAFVGAVVFEKSPRHIPPLHAATLFDRARGKAKIVAVLVDPDDALLTEVEKALCKES